MPSAAYSFIDVAVLDGVRERFASGDAIVILSSALTEVLWANGPGAALFGHDGIERIVGADSGLGFAARRQIMATKGFPDIGRDRAVTVRLAQGLDSRAMAFSASAIELPGGEQAIMLAVPAGLAGAPDTEIAARAISGFTEPGHLVAFLDAHGAVEAASPDFLARDISMKALADLVTDVAGEADRLVKRIVSTGSSRLPAGIARLRDDPARHLLVMIDEDQSDGTGDADETADVAAAVAVEAAPAVDEADSAEPDAVDALLMDGEPEAIEPAPSVETAAEEPTAEAANVNGPADIPVAADGPAIDGPQEHPLPSIDEVWGPQDAAEPAGERATADSPDLTAPETATALPDQSPEPATAALDEPAADGEQPAENADSTAAASAAPAPEPIAAPPAAPMATRHFDRSAAPVRFVWKTDAAGRFSALSPEFLDVVGATSDDVVGKSFAQLFDALRLDPQGEIAGLLERRDTWSGRSVLWPVAGTEFRVPVDLAALPIYSRDRSFEGFRGFGVARITDSVADGDAAGPGPGAEMAAEPAPQTAESPADASPRGAETKAAASADPFQGEVPALTITPKPERRSSDKVIRLAEHRPQAPEKGLSNVERNAFREIGERLKKSGGIDGAPEAGATAGDRPSQTADTETVPVSTNDNSDFRALEKTSGEAETIGAEKPSDVDEIDAVSAAIFEAPASDTEAQAEPSAEEVSAVSDTAPEQGAETVAEAIAESTADLTTPDAAAEAGSAEAAAGAAEPTPELTTAHDGSADADEVDTIVVHAGEGAAAQPLDAASLQTDAAPAWLEASPRETHADADTVSIDAHGTEPAGSSSPKVEAEAIAGHWQDSSPRETDADTVSIGHAEVAPNDMPASAAEVVTGDEPRAEFAPEWQEAPAHEAAAETVSAGPAETEPSDLSAPAMEVVAGHDAPLGGDSATDETAANDAIADAVSVDHADEQATDPAEPALAADATDEPPERVSPASDTADAPETVSPVAAARAAIAQLKTGGFMPSAFSQPASGGRRFQDTAILSRLPVPLLIHSGDVLHYANDEFLNLTGYASLDALRQAGGLGTLFSDPYGDEARDQSGRSLRMRTADGLEFPIEALLRSVPWSGGHALMLVIRRTGDAHDVSDTETPVPQQADVEALKARVSEMRAIVDTATDGVILITREGVIRSISRPAEALFGFDSDEVSGKPFVSLFAMESQRAARDYLNGLTDHGVASVLNDGREVIGREAQGRFIPLFMTIGMLPNDSGYCAVVRDITQWKRAEEELTQARSMAERASSQKSDFLARISHEIRTPLNAIIGFSELMIDERFGTIGNDRYRDYLRDINRSGNHVLELVNDLLDISKIEAGEQEMSYEAVSLNETLAQTVAMMQPQANRERVIIRSSFASRLPDVVADARSVRQIALNLLSNAVRYTQAGGQVIVSTSYESAGDVVMRVRDTGVGMTQAEIEQALKPFKQINALKRSRGDGTGLGLPLTKAMVEANRARFTINSTPGEGTLVEVAFPSTRVLAN